MGLAAESCSQIWFPCLNMRYNVKATALYMYYSYKFMSMSIQHACALFLTIFESKTLESYNLNNKQKICEYVMIDWFISYFIEISDITKLYDKQKRTSRLATLKTQTLRKLS